MDTIEQTLDFSTFANYGGNLEREIHSEVLISLLTPKRTVSGYRKFGTDIPRSINQPLNIQRFLTLLSQSIESLQIYNDDAPTDDERRVAVDADSFDFEYPQVFQGITSMTVYYYRLKDLQRVSL